MSISGIQGQLLEVTVVGCFRLKNTEWISRQDPYVCLEYGSTKHRTRTCTDGGKNPVFQEKLVLNLIEGLREINVVVWNSNTLSSDDFIGAGKIQIQYALSRGYDDRAWPLQTKTGRYAGEVKLIMHYANANANQPASFMPYGAPSQHHQAACNYYRPPPSSALPPPVSTYQPQPYSSFSSYSYPPNMTSNTPPPPHLPYPSPSHEAYPPQPYPPPPQQYPPPPQPSPYSHSGYYTGAYPPPPPY